MPSPTPASPTSPSSRSLMRAAMLREPTPRIPTMPQICHDTPARLYAADYGRDWIDAIGRCIEQPGAIYDLVIRLVREVGADGLRLFVKPDPMKVTRTGDELVVSDAATGARLGKVDLHGGGGIIRDQPPPPVETTDDVRKRLDAFAAAITDEKLALLSQARARVPDLFVASSPGGITMNTYNDLRGREQAMCDFFERPDFVTDTLRRQAEAVIRRAERLLAAGIDALYIGDPSASCSLISPAHFEEFCLPAYQLFCSHFPRPRAVPIYIHVCGNSKPILEMLADTGADVVEPLDPLGGVSVADAKQRIGGRVALMGGVNTVTLSRGTPEQVRDEAIRKCREGGPHGYILAAGDMVPPDTSMANVRALVEVATRSQWR